MHKITSTDNEFLKGLTRVIEAHIAEENFGVSELSDEVGMSRSNLLRKVKKLTNLSVSQFIRQIRLQKAMDMLRTESFNVSEVAFKVGFSSISYFVKCFREHYGFPPGEVGKRDFAFQETPTALAKGAGKRRMVLILAGAGLMLVAAVVSLMILKPETPTHLEKSIVVLPFKNDSNDSSNVYLINGLMEATLNNLQKIKDLRVLSRTSAEKYRNSTRSIPEIAAELNVNYFVEGSGQKIGDRILLNIQLIDASTDQHLWAQQYRRKVTDIFELQQEVSKRIASEIEAVITPEEEERIDKIPTENLVAYDYYLKGLDFLSKGSEYLIRAVPEFKAAIAEDPQFALAHASLAITYYYLDIFQEDKQYMAELNNHADKALLLDPKLAQSLMAKAFYYMNKKEYAEAVPFMEKAYEYNPNSTQVINSLSNFYGLYMPNTSKYLEYALKGVKLDAAGNDSVTTSYTYLHLSNSLIQNGFVDEALKYIDKALEYYPDNPHGGRLRAFILYGKTHDLQKTRALLIEELKRDSTSLDILQDIGKVSYYLRDFEGAWKYYKQFIEIREAWQLDVYTHENLMIGDVMLRMGLEEKAQEYFEEFKVLADADESMYKPLLLTGYYMQMGDQAKAFEQMRLFAEEKSCLYWIVLFLEDDPLLEELMDTPECKKLVAKIKDRFWANHEKLKLGLEEEGLL